MKFKASPRILSLHSQWRRYFFKVRDQFWNCTGCSIGTEFRRFKSFNGPSSGAEISQVKEIFFEAKWKCDGSAVSPSSTTI